MKLTFPYQPRLLFLLVFISLSLAAYSPFDIIVKIWIFVLGVLFPVGLGIWGMVHENAPLEGETPPWREEFLPSVSGWVWVTAGIFILSVYLYRITQIPLWPCMDDGLIAFYSMELSKKWDWRLIYGFSQGEPLFFWLSALFFKCFGRSLDSMRVFPLLLSFLTMGAAYFAARKYLSRSVSFFILVLYGLNYWNLLESRRFERPDLICFFEFSALYALAQYRGQTPGRKWIFGVILGLLLGSGMYVYTAWPVFVAVILLAVWFLDRSDGEKTGNGFAAAVGTAFVVTLPMVFARLKMGGLTYATDLLSDKALFRYVGSLFFNGFGGMPPAWGGVLNSLLGSFFWIGLVETLRWRKNKTIQWIYITGLLTFLPGGLTSHVEIFRVGLLIPFLIFLSGWGAVRLIKDCGPQPYRRWAVLTAVIVCSLSLDLYHYYGPTQDQYSLSPIPSHWASIQHYRAYGLLESQAAQGNGVEILNYFDGAQEDWAFDLFAQDTNSKKPTREDKTNPREIALITNSNYLPFLEKRFPGSRWRELGSDLPIQEGGLALGELVFSGRNSGILEFWREADAQLEDLTAQSAFLKPHESPQAVINQLLDREHDWNQDPFLQAQCAEKIAGFVLRDPMLDRHAAINSLKKALERCPAANLYNLLGLLWLEVDQPLKAKEAFQSALKAPVNTTLAETNLRKLQNWARNNHFKGI